VQENDVEQLGKVVTLPLERALQKLDRVEQVNSMTTHWRVEVELLFKGETTDQDLAMLASHLDQVRFDEGVKITSRVIELRPPRLMFDDVQEQR
jgi:multidrug efflux pump subunit AcrB